MSQPVTIFDNQQPANVRLSADAQTALGIPDATVPVKGVQLQGGWLLVDYQVSSTVVRRYAFPPQAVRYVSQDITQSAPLPPPAQG